MKRKKKNSTSYQQTLMSSRSYLWVRVLRVRENDIAGVAWVLVSVLQHGPHARIRVVLGVDGDDVCQSRTELCCVTRHREGILVVCGVREHRSGRELAGRSLGGHFPLKHGPALDGKDKQKKKKKKEKKEKGKEKGKRKSGKERC